MTSKAKAKSLALKGGFQPYNTLDGPPSEDSASSNYKLVRKEPPTQEDSEFHPHKTARAKPMRPPLIFSGQKRSSEEAQTDADEPARKKQDCRVYKVDSPDPLEDDLGTEGTNSPDPKSRTRTHKAQTTSYINHPRPNRFNRKAEGVDTETDDELADGLPPRTPAMASNRLRLSRPTAADVQKTNFQGPKLKLELRRAACSNSIYDANDAADADNSQQIYLGLRDHLCLGPVTSEGGPIGNYPWLEVSFKKLHQVHACQTFSPVVVNRAAGANVGPVLLLDFASETDHKRFMKWIQDCQDKAQGVKFKISFKDCSEMQTKFNKMFRESRTRSGGGQVPANDVEYLEHCNSNQEEQPSETGRIATPTGQTLRPSLGRSMKTGRVTVKASPDFVALDNDDSLSLFKRTRRSVVVTPPKPVRGRRWSDEHPGWDQIWDARPLIYPPTGRNSAQITKEDIPRLDEGELFNDNLIVFYSRYLQLCLEKKNLSVFRRTYIMNPWFYEKLSQKKGRGIDYDAVKSWTAKVDLFEYDYVVVPVNERMHWYLAIICYPGKLLPQKDADEDVMMVDAPPEATEKPEQSGSSPVSTPHKHVEGVEIVNVESDLVAKQTPRSTQASALMGQETVKPKNVINPGDPRVITLDSLGGAHSPTCTNLREYLVQEAKHRRGVEISPPNRFGFTAKGIPEQDDFSSCGAYLLGYMERFFQNPDLSIEQIVLKKDPKWEIDPSIIRSNIRDLIIRLREEQNQRILDEKEAKKRAKTSRQSAQNTESVPSSPMTQPNSGTNDPTELQETTKDDRSDSPSSGIPAGAQPPESLVTEGEAPTETPETILEPIRQTGRFTNEAVATMPEGLVVPLSSTPCRDSTSPPLAPHMGALVSSGSGIPSRLVQPVSDSPVSLEEYRDVLGVRSDQVSSHGASRSTQPTEVIYLDGDEPTKDPEGDGPNAGDETGDTSEVYFTASETTPTPARQVAEADGVNQISNPRGGTPNKSTEKTIETIEIPDDSPRAPAPNQCVTSAYFVVKDDVDTGPDFAKSTARKKRSQETKQGGNPFVHQRAVDLTADD